MYVQVRCSIVPPEASERHRKMLRWARDGHLRPAAQIGVRPSVRPSVRACVRPSVRASHRFSSWPFTLYSLERPRRKNAKNGPGPIFFLAVYTI